MDVARVAEPGCRTRRCHPRHHAACVALQPGRDHHSAGERLRDRHMSGGRRPPGPANVGVTEDRGQVVWKIKQQLK